MEEPDLVEAAHGETIDDLQAMEDIISRHIPGKVQDFENIQALPLRAYLDQSIVPLLVEGLRILSKERPPNPTEWLGLFLLKNSSSRK